MTDEERTRPHLQPCHHQAIAYSHEHLTRPHSHNIHDVAIILSESLVGPTPWTARENSMRDTVARILSKQGAEMKPKFVCVNTIFSLMQTVDELCFLGLLFPTTHINHTSHPVFLEIGQARGRVGWTQALRSKPGQPGQRAGPSILIRLSTVRHRDDGKTECLSLKEVVQVAVHEMVHAYLLLLSCRKEQCGADFEVMHRDADGGGHGLAFVAVLKAVLGQIQSWGPGLEEFGMTDDAICPYEDFSLKLWKRGEGLASRGKGQRVWWLAAKPL